MKIINVVLLFDLSLRNHVVIKEHESSTVKEYSVFESKIRKGIFKKN